MVEPAEIIAIPAAITERGQTTVPAAIRKMLALGKRDRVVFRGLADGTVVIARQTDAAEDDGDPVLGRFLDFLERDMAAAPQRVAPVPQALLARGRALVEGVEVDLDAALPEDER